MKFFVNIDVNLLSWVGVCNFCIVATVVKDKLSLCLLIWCSEMPCTFMYIKIVYCWRNLVGKCPIHSVDVIYLKVSFLQWHDNVECVCWILWRIYFKIMVVSKMMWLFLIFGSCKISRTSLNSIPFLGKSLYVSINSASFFILQNH